MDGESFTMSAGDSLNPDKYVKSGISDMKVMKLDDGKLYAPMREIIYLYNQALRESNYTLDISWDSETKQIAVTIYNQFSDY